MITRADIEITLRAIDPQTPVEDIDRLYEEMRAAEIELSEQLAWTAHKEWTEKNGMAPADADWGRINSQAAQQAYEFVRQDYLGLASVK